MELTDSIKCDLILLPSKKEQPVLYGMKVLKECLAHRAEEGSNAKGLGLLMKSKR